MRVFNFISSLYTLITIVAIQSILSMVSAAFIKIYITEYCVEFNAGQIHCFYIKNRQNFYCIFVKNEHFNHQPQYYVLYTVPSTYYNNKYTVTVCWGGVRYERNIINDCITWNLRSCPFISVILFFETESFHNVIERKNNADTEWAIKPVSLSKCVREKVMEERAKNCKNRAHSLQ